MKKKNKNVKSLFYIAQEIFFSCPHKIIFFFFLQTIDFFFIIINVSLVAPVIDYAKIENSFQNSFVTNQYIKILKFFEIVPSLTFFILAFILSLILKQLSNICLNFYLAKIKYFLMYENNYKAIKNLLRSNLEFYNSLSQGKLLNTYIKDLDNLSDLSVSLLRFYLNIFQVFSYLFYPLYVAFTLVFVALIFFSTLIFLLNKILRKKLKELSEKNLLTANIFIGFLNKILQSFRLIKIRGIEDFFSRKYKKLMIEHSNVTIKFQLVSELSSFFLLPLSVSFIFLIFLELKNNSVYYSDVGIIIFSLLNISLKAGNLTQNFFLLKKNIPNYNQFKNFSDLSIKNIEKSDGVSFTKLKKSINLKKVQFNYKNKASTLKDINFEFRKNSITGICGDSGVGKSTLIDLISSFKQPTKGAILIDNIDFKKINLSSYRKKIFYVSQDPIFFNASIKDNLTLFDKSIPIKNINNSLKKTAIFTFINSLKKKLNTVIGDYGKNLSGGEKQRLSLARGLLFKPQILLLDEATSSLDSINETAILRTLKILKKNCTIIMISHKLSSLRICDQIILLKKGKIFKKGDFNKISKSNFFRV